MKKQPATKINVKKNTRRVNYIPVIVLAVLAFVLYENTLSHEFALDDKVVLVENDFVQDGVSGIRNIFMHDSFYGFFGENVNYVEGSRYRPLSLAFLAVEHEFFGNNPGAYHFFNVFYYVLLVLLLYFLLKKLFPDQDRKRWYLSIAFIAALIFLFHPVHTEVVANIKSRDEIFAMIFSVLTLIFSLRYIENGKKWILMLCGLFLFFGLLSKEIAIVMLFIVPATLILFRWEKKKPFFIEVGWVFLALIIHAGLYLLFRQQATEGSTGEVVNELMNKPFLLADTSQKYGTIFYTLGLYLKLLVFPHPLTYDYYPFHIQYVNLFSLKSMLPLLLNLVLAVCGIYLFFVLLKKKISGGETKSPEKTKKTLVFIIMLYFVPLLLVSNLFFEIGAFMAERFLFFPSLGFAVFLGWLLSTQQRDILHKIKNLNTYKIMVLIIVVFGFGAKTIHRNKAWKNNETLFLTDIKTSHNSAKGNVIVGELLYKKSKEENDKSKKGQFLKKAIPYLEKAIQIHPRYEAAYVKLGNAYRDYGQLDKAVSCYRKLVDFMPYSKDGNIQLGVFYANYRQKPDSAIYFYKKILKYTPDLFKPNFDIGTVYITKHVDYKEGIKYLEKASKIEPHNFNVYRNMAGGYFYLEKYEIAIEYFEKALSFKPNAPALLNNLLVTSKKAGDQHRVNKYKKRCAKIKNKR